MESGDTAETLNIKVSRPESTISGVASCEEHWDDKVALGRGLV